MKNWIKAKKNWLIIIAIVMSIIFGYFIWDQKKTEKINSQEIKTAKATKGNVSVSLKIDGKTIIKSQNLSFQIGGIIRSITVKEGDLVEPWQTLAYLDTREAQKNLETALRDYSKERNDFDEDVQITYEDQTITDTFKRILEKNQWDLEKSIIDVELKNIVKSKSYLATSIKGTVAQVNYQAGEIPLASTPVIIIVDEDSFHFESFVEDIEALKIKKDMKVRISLDAIEDKIINGKVSFISPIAKIDDNDLSTYKVTINFDDIDQTIIDGLIGEAEIISKEVTDVIKIPNNAVTREDGKSIVNLKNNDSYEQREVELGFTNGKEVEVLSGLSLGDEVIVWQ